MANLKPGGAINPKLGKRLVYLAQLSVSVHCCPCTRLVFTPCCQSLSAFQCVEDSCAQEVPRCSLRYTKASNHTRSR